MVNFDPLAAEIISLVWGTPANFKGFGVLAALLHGTLVIIFFTTLTILGCLAILRMYDHSTTPTVLRPFFQDHPGELVPEENFWALWCKGRLTEADTQTIRLGATPYGPTSAHLHHPHIFLQAGCPSCRPTNSVRALHLHV